MLNSENVLEELKNSGFKITKARKALIELLLESNQPLSVPEISSLLRNLNANKTTIYREISFLIDQGVVKEIDFGESKKRYEYDFKKHHHHLVCVSCKRIEDIEVEANIEAEEKRIEKISGFRVVNHSLEFFGICRRCQH